MRLLRACVMITTEAALTRLPNFKATLWFMIWKSKVRRSELSLLLRCVTSSSKMGPCLVVSIAFTSFSNKILTICLQFWLSDTFAQERISPRIVSPFEWRASQCPLITSKKSSLRPFIRSLTGAQSSSKNASRKAKKSWLIVTLRRT